MRKWKGLLDEFQAAVGFNRNKKLRGLSNHDSRFLTVELKLIKTPLEAVDREKKGLLALMYK